MTPLKQRKTRPIRQRETCTIDSLIIVTNAKKTEQNYIQGLKHSLPDDRTHKVTIDFIVKDPQCFVELLQDSKFLKNILPIYGVPHKWIFFDRDQVQSFDKIIQDAEDKGISVAWSNPCLEVWFWAYFEKVPFVGDPDACITGFKNVFSRKTKMEYKKGDPNIYDHLHKYGDENSAFEWAKKKRDEFQKELPHQYSQWIPSTTCDELVKKIRGLTEGN